MLQISSTIDTRRSALSVKNLTVQFPSLGRDSRPAIDDLSLTVNPGEIVGLVGESGAGKTVLARSLLGLPPRPGRISSGQIFFGDQDLLSLGEQDRRKRRGSEISMIVPNPRNELNPLIPVGDQIATMLEVHRRIPRKQALAGALEMLRAVQIPDPLARMHALPQELSGGMAQRIVIAIALVCRPQFIVSDDATSGLDVTVQAQILVLLQKLVRENHSSMLFITRDIGIAAHFCDRVAVLYRGRIMEIAPRDAFFLRPSNPTTIMLMTAFSHNQRLRGLWAPTNTAGSDLPKSGCVYANRCPLAQEVCRNQGPALREIADGHMTRCHFPVIR